MYIDPYLHVFLQSTVDVYINKQEEYMHLPVRLQDFPESSDQTTPLKPLLSNVTPPSSVPPPQNENSVHSHNKCVSCGKPFKGLITKRKHESLCIQRRILVLTNQLNTLDEDKQRIATYITNIQKRLFQQEEYMSGAAPNQLSNINSHITKLRAIIDSHQRKLEEKEAKHTEVQHQLNHLLDMPGNHVHDGGISRGDTVEAGQEVNTSATHTPVNTYPEEARSSRQQQKRNHMRHKRQSVAYVDIENVSKRMKYSQADEQDKIRKRKCDYRRENHEKMKQQDKLRKNNQRADVRKADVERHKQNVKHQHPQIKEQRKLRQQQRRTDVQYMTQEYLRQRQCHQEAAKQQDLSSTCAAFLRAVSEGPLYVCSSCLQTNFKSHMSDVAKLQTSNHEELLVKCISSHIILNNTTWTISSCENPTVQIRSTNICEDHVSFDQHVWLCNTCKGEIYKGLMPKLCTANKVGFPPKPDVLNLHPLEETLIAPIIPFMTVRSLPVSGMTKHGQKLIVGNVVHVPNDIAKTVKQLPRSLDDMGTIAVSLKRKMAYKHAVFQENIRPESVVNALTYLVKESSMFGNIEISVRDWIQEVQNSNHPNKLFLADVYPQSRDEMTHIMDVSASPTPVMEENQACSAEDMLEDNDFTEGTCAAPVGNMDTLLTEKVPLKLHTGLQAHNAKDNETPTPTAEEQNVMLNLAPGEGNRPVYREPQAEYLSFPTIFSGQERPKSSERERHVYTSQIFKAELCHKQPFVWKSTANIFWKAKHLLEQSLATKANFLLRRVIGVKKYTAGQLQDPGIRQNIEQLNEGYMFLRTIRGSPAYFEDKKKKVMAMVRQLGVPTLFFSLSAADTSWPALLRTLGVLVDNKTYTDQYIQNEMSFEDKCRLVSAHPIACSRYFNERVKQFVNLILTTQQSPFNQAEDYVYRVEFQQRGSPHIHGLLWISTAPKLDVHTHEEICQYIDKCISCSLDVSDDELPFIKLQLHRHSRTCRKFVSGKKVCRFGIPTFPMRHTVILHPHTVPPENADAIKKQLLEVQQQMKSIPENIANFDDWLAYIRMSESDYIQLVSSTLSRPKIFLKRTPQETRVNPYMKSLLNIWQANHDVQFVLDTYQCVTYVCDYMAKSQRGMSDLLHQASQECQTGNLAPKDAMWYISQQFINAVEMPVQECAYHMLGLHIVSSSRKTEFICTCPSDVRVSVMKSMQELEELPSSSKDVTYKSNIDRYTMRPKVLESWCLAEYVAWINIRYPARKKHHDLQEKVNDNPCNQEDTDDDSVHSDMDPTGVFPYTLRNGITLCKRLRPKVIRFVNYRKKSDSEEYFRERLMLYTAWRKEDDIKGELHSYAEAFQAQKHTVMEQISKFEPMAAVLQDVEDEYIEEQQLQRMLRGSCITQPPAESSTSDYDFRQAIGVVNIHVEPEIELLPQMMTNSDFFALLSSLNIQQQEFFHHILTVAQQTSQHVMCALHGGAGTGKSHVTKAVYQGLCRLYNRQAGDTFTSKHVIVLAPTGKAAYNIHGTTIHHALHILPNRSMDYKPLPWDVLNKLRNDLTELQWVLIDEFSMVGNKMLKLIYLRLQEIKGNQKPFGGVNIVCIGDLYQLRPVLQEYIFTQITDDYDLLAPNLWTQHFSIFELFEIMRQKDDQDFAKLLNRLRIGQHTQSDIRVLKSRLITQDESETMCGIPHFFPTRSQRDMYNERMMTKQEGFEITVTARDAAPSDQSASFQEKILEAAKNKKDVSSTGNLPYKLTLKVGQQYDITANINVEDGLINGTECRIRQIDLQEGSHFPNVVWLTFSDPNIGQKTRYQTHPKYQSLTQQGWTPLEPIQRRFVVKRSQTVTRQQFPLRLAAGRTIHVSQSGTYESIVIDMHTDSKPRSNFWEHMHYVAFSRCTTLQGLHIVSLNEECIRVSSQVHKYVTHDKKLLQLCYTPSYNTQNLLKICYNNVCSISSKWNLIKNNHHMQNCDIVFISETWLRPQQHVNTFMLPSYQILRLDSQHVPGHRGMICWINSHLPIHRHELYETRALEACLIVIDLPLTCVNIIAVYKPPTTSLHVLKENVEQVLQRCDLTNPTLLMGDFNIDLSEVPGHTFTMFMKNTYNMTQFIEDPTTTDGTIIDVVFANFTDLSTFPLVNGWSNHHTITSYLPLNVA